ncbi:MAG: hypothetical protein V4671_20170 [Armatimonadota bacterium]
MLSEAEVVAQRVIRAFDVLGIEYAIGGSVASTVHGIPRLTMDVDIIADMGEAHIEPLVAALQEEFYADADMMREAIRHYSSFNLIHLATMVKADIFLLPTTPFAASEWSRRQYKKIGADLESPEAYVASAEDMILQKLNWYRLTGERSDRQWGDVQGMLKVQGTALDFAYLAHWAEDLAVSDLLKTALEDAGLEQEKGT